MAEFIDVKQAASVARCSIFRIRDAIKDGSLKAYRPGKSYVIDTADLDVWIKKCRAKPAKST